jgi:sugar phosphate isomerase/epimerase
MQHIGYHAVYEGDFQTALTAAANNGFGYVQFDLNVPAFYIDEMPRHKLNHIATLSNDLGLAISFHAPGDTIGLFADYPRIRKGILDHMKRILEKANRLQAHHLTVHPLNPPSFRRADSMEDEFQVQYHDYFRQVLIDNLHELSQASGSVLINVENCHFGRIAVDALTEMCKTGTDTFLTLDWAKMHDKRQAIDESQERFFFKYRERIRELHVHDMNALGRSHLCPPEGVLDFEPLFRDFYDPSQWITIEVRPVIEATRAKEMVLGMIGKREGT